jgi:hypothetical protein
MRAMLLLARTAWLAWPLLLMGCAPLLPAPQATQAEVLKVWGEPTARHALPGGGQRLEYATGPWGRHTWMIDLDAAGRTSSARQVLSDTAFIAIQQRPGLTAQEVLVELGSPGERRAARGGGQTWTWRYPTNDCLWFQLSVGADSLVLGGAFLPDPTCDGPNDGHA